MNPHIKNLFWSITARIVNHASFYQLIANRFPKTVSPATDTRLCSISDHPYPDLTTDTGDNGKTNSLRPVFITARFRSGSTLLWNIFRNTEGVHSYYEPFNEGLCFNQSQNNKSTDATHIGVEEYWSEYDGLCNAEALFCTDWAAHNLLMDRSSYNRAMKLYIEELIACAPARPVLQFNRVDLRLPWLRANFRNATIIHLFRHPRDLWMSVCSKSAPVGLELENHDFSQYNLFYTMEWAQDLSHDFPFLNPGLKRHPYYYHYLLWKLSYIYGRAYSDLSISYEELTRNPEKTLKTLAEILKMDALQDKKLLRLISPAKPTRWSHYADDEWYRTIENECNDIITAFFSASYGLSDNNE